MVIEKTAIHFKVICDGQEHELVTYPNEYRNLMMLIFDKIYVEGFGECGGMGRCGTCTIEITGLPDHLNEMARNEEATLNKKGAGPNLRLACQFLIDKNLENTTINIVDNY
ncbi:MAG TPA: 2Fe-2S iron-sulfur cluster-binding protein [Chitinophagaceae bacterium]|jgi:Ferredoxin